MQIEEINFNPKFAFLSGQKEILKNIIEWKDNPPIVKTGRSTFLVIENDNLPFKGIKIKGCGYFNLFKNESLPPSDKNFDMHIIQAPDGIKEIHYQICVDDKNELAYSIPAKRPFGGQTYSKAKLEFDVNNELLKNWKEEDENFPFYYPIGYAKYKDLTFNKENLGVTILGSKSVSEVPLSAYFEGRFEENGLRINPYLVKYWQNNLSVLGEKEPDYFDLLSTLKKLCFEFGKTLRDFHDYYVDFDSHFFNATVNQDSGRVVLYDFDHVSEVCKMHPQKYFYYSLKDFEIGLTAIISNFLMSGLVDGIPMFNELKEPINDYNLINAYFEGYFKELSPETKTLTENMWERIIMLLTNKLLNAKQEQVVHIVYDFCELERDKSYMDIFPQLFAKIQSKFENFIFSKENHEKIITAFLRQKKDMTKQYKM